jgi:hypothetical protein
MLRSGVDDPWQWRLQRFRQGLPRQGGSRRHPERGGSHANHCSLDTYGTIGATGIAFVANDAITPIEARRAGYSN